MTNKIEFISVGGSGDEPIILRTDFIQYIEPYYGSRSAKSEIKYYPDGNTIGDTIIIYSTDPTSIIFDKLS